MALISRIGAQENERFIESAIVTKTLSKPLLFALSQSIPNKFVGKSYLGVYSHLC